MMFFLPLTLFLRIFILSSNSGGFWNIFKSPNSIQPDSCYDISDSEKIDCYSDGMAKVANCLSRQCCWNPISDGINVPWCYYPPSFPSYKLTETKETKSGITGNLELIGDFDTFGQQYKSLFLNVQYVSDKVLRIQILPQTTEKQKNHIHLNINNNNEYFNPDYEIKLNQDQFSLSVERKSTGNTVFNTSVGPLIFSSQYLQISTSLSSNVNYGLGEHSRKPMLSINWERFTLFNSDSGRQKDRTSLYGSYPYILSIDENGNSNGLLFLNTHPMDAIVSPAPSVTFYAIGGIIDFFVIVGNDPESVTKSLNSIFYPSYMPPYWALGFHLSKYGYNDFKSVINLLTKMWQFHVPIDGQFIDIDLLSQRRDFYYNETDPFELKTFEMLLTSKNVKFVPIIDAAISFNDSYYPFTLGHDLDIFVKIGDSKRNLIGKVWPGEAVFPDFSHPNISAYLTTLINDFYSKLKFGGFWIDMNEPSNFIDGSVSGCPSNNLENPPFTPHVVFKDLNHKTICMSSFHYDSYHYSIHNIYGYLNALTISQALAKTIKKRTILLSRSTFIGSGSYTGHWLGDDTSSWEDLRSSVSGIINSNLFGVAFVGADICGFSLNSTEELCTRWHQLGAFYSFCRNHASDQSSPQDPFAFSPNHLASVTASLKLRYKLLPYLYTLFYQMHTNMIGTVIRGLFVNFPTDVPSYDIVEQFMWGSGLLISPVLYPNKTSVDAYFPPGLWYDFYDGNKIESTGEIISIQQPLYTSNLHVFGGNIIPMQDPADNTHFSMLNPYSLIVALLPQSESAGYLYVDDGDTLMNDPSLLSSMINFTANQDGMKTKLVSNDYKLNLLLRSVIVYGKSCSPTRVMVNGNKKPFSYNRTSLVLKIEKLSVNLKVPFYIDWSS